MVWLPAFQFPFTLWCCQLIAGHHIRLRSGARCLGMCNESTMLGKILYGSVFILDYSQGDLSQETAVGQVIFVEGNLRLCYRKQFSMKFRRKHTASTFWCSVPILALAHKVHSIKFLHCEFSLYARFFIHAERNMRQPWEVPLPNSLSVLALSGGKTPTNSNFCKPEVSAFRR